MRSKFLYSEQRLSEVSGISRVELVKLRKEKLVKGVDWRQSKKGKGRPVELTENAARSLTWAFGIGPALEIGAALIKKGGDATSLKKSVTTVNGSPKSKPESEPIQAKVSFLCENPRRLNAKDVEGKEYQVIVGNNALWTTGDQLTLRKSEQNPVLYWEIACKPPRFRGDPLHRLQFPA